MAKVLLYSESLVDDRIWANQFHNHDRTTRRKIDTGAAADWAVMTSRVEEAAKAAGSGGVVFFLGGHSVPSEEGNPNAAWISVCHGGKVILNSELTHYDVKGFPVANQPSRKDQDDKRIAEAEEVKTFKGQQEYLKFMKEAGASQASQSQAIATIRGLAAAAEVRRKRRGFYDRMGAAFGGNAVGRVVFLSCRIAQEPALLKKISKDWGVEVVAYKQFITLQNVDGKVLLFLSPTREGTGPQRSNHDLKFIPDINVHTAFVATP